MHDVFVISYNTQVELSVCRLYSFCVGSAMTMLQLQVLPAVASFQLITSSSSNQQSNFFALT